jgi:alanyl-tRNA synthetase
VTERLYYTDSYLLQFEASVVERRDAGTRIYLDRTAFYPTSGGQPFDTGELSGIRIIDVVDEGERIAHLLASPLETERVRGQIDWARRFDHMQQHSGQHLLSAVAAESLGMSTVAVHFGRDSSTLDLEATQLTADQVITLERTANRIVCENRPIQVSFEEASEAIGLRRRPERTGTIRIITIQELDRSACGGTHVRTTGEIGPVLLRKIERVRKAIRVEFICGLRAIDRARAEYGLLSEVSAQLSAAAHELPQVVDAQRLELRAARSSLRETEGQLDKYRARDLYQSAAPDAAGMRRVILRDSGSSLEELRRLAQVFSTLSNAMFIGVVSEPAALVLSTSADSGIDAAQVLKDLLSAAKGRGGGSARLAQGTVPGSAELEQVLAAIGMTEEVGSKAQSAGKG